MSNKNGNSRNGKYGTTNTYNINSDVGVVTDGISTRAIARTVKKHLTKTLGLKNTDLSIVQVSYSIVR